MWTKRRDGLLNQWMTISSQRFIEESLNFDLIVSQKNRQRFLPAR
jgi:hypothetical protein